MNIPYIVVGIFALIGVFVLFKFFIFFYFLFIHKYKQLTREKIIGKLKGKFNVTKELFGGGTLGNLIGGFIVIIVGINLISGISEQVTEIGNNVTALPSTTNTMLNTVPLFFGLAIGVVGIALAVGGLRRGGLI